MTDVLKSANITQHENSINLVARLMLMIRMGGVPTNTVKEDILNGKRVIFANSYTTISDFLPLELVTVSNLKSHSML